MAIAPWLITGIVAALFYISCRFTFVPYDNAPHNYVSRAAPGALLPGEYYFGASNLKEVDAAYVQGDSCDNLRGSGYAGPRGHNYESIRYGAALGPFETEMRQKWHDARKNEAFWTCYPKVKDISRYLAQGGDTDGRTVWLNNGPNLYWAGRKPDGSSKPKLLTLEQTTALPLHAAVMAGNVGEVKKVYSCGEAKTEFCATIVFYTYSVAAKKYEMADDSGDYRIFCWRCGKLRASPKSLQNAVQGGINVDYSSRVFRLDGGFMARDYFSPQNLKDAATAERLQRFRLWASIGSD